MIRWFRVLEGVDTNGDHDGPMPLPPRRALSYEAIMADAAAAAEQQSLPHRYRYVALVDADSAPETEEELRHLVQTVPLFSAIFKAGQNVQAQVEGYTASTNRILDILEEAAKPGQFPSVRQAKLDEVKGMLAP